MTQIFKHIILGIDGSEEAKNAALKGLGIAKSSGTEVTAVYVIDLPYLARDMPPGTITPVIEDILRTEAENALNEIKNMAKEIGLDISTKIYQGIPEQAIIEAAAEGDLVVLGSRGRGLVKELLVGSVSHKVLHHSKAAVMIVKNQS